jgi:hypothetical protein
MSIRGCGRMKHIKIISNDNIVLEKAIGECESECPCFDYNDGFGSYCKLAEELNPNSEYNPEDCEKFFKFGIHPNCCPLEDVE